MTEDTGEWDAWCAAAGIDDIYFRLSYARLWAPYEGARAIGLRLRTDAGVLLYPVLQVPLDALPGGVGRCDLRTAYDFGGPLALGPDAAALHQEFRHALDELSARWRVVTELARLHPLRFAAGSRPTDAALHGENFIINLREGYDAARGAYQRIFWRNVKRARKRGLVASLHPAPSPSLRATFIQFYWDTMHKLSASAYYFFDRETLTRLMALPEMSLVIVRRPAEAPGEAEPTREGDVIAAALFLRSADDLFYYLGASDQRALDLRPNNLLFDHVVQHGCTQGLERLHLGGGSPGLRRFKGQMASGTPPYHLLKRVHDPAAYAELCAGAKVDPESGEFPAYRGVLARHIGPPAAMPEREG
jgi:hypothetical protein